MALEVDIRLMLNNNDNVAIIMIIIYDNDIIIIIITECLKKHEKCFLCFPSDFMAIL